MKFNDPMVQTVVKHIGEIIHPEKIILFGSRARGGARPDSDIDLLILYKGPLSKRQVKRKIRDFFVAPEFAMDLFVLEPEEFEAQKPIVATLGRIVSQEGIVCYG